MSVTPTRQLGLLALVLVAIWYAAVSQGNSIAYLIAFILVGIGLTSLLQTWQNLRRVTVGVQPAAPVFAGEMMALPVHFRNTRGQTSYGLRGVLPAQKGVWEEAAVSVDNLSGVDWEERTLETRTLRRGRFPITRFHVESAFPLGLLRMRKRVAVTGEILIFPKLEGTQSLPLGEISGLTEHEGTRPEGDNFSGVRPYQAGDSQRHVDWKAAARSSQLVTKLFTGGGDERVLLDWDEVQVGNREKRLSQLARWVVDAEQNNLEYSLKLPGGVHIAASNGAAHFHRCLATLAEYRVRADDAYSRRDRPKEAQASLR